MLAGSVQISDQVNTFMPKDLSRYISWHGLCSFLKTVVLSRWANKCTLRISSHHPNLNTHNHVTIDVYYVRQNANDDVLYFFPACHLRLAWDVLFFFSK